MISSNIGELLQGELDNEKIIPYYLDRGYPDELAESAG